MTVFTADAERFVRLIDTAKAFAGDDVTLPMLRCIRLERRDNELLAIATDRFLMGVTRIDVNWDDDTAADWSTLIYRDDIDLIVSNYKGKGGRGRKITATARANGFKFACTGSPVELSTEHVDLEFPKWRNLVRPAVEDEDAGGGVAPLLDLAKLKTFDKAKWSTNDFLRIRYASRTDRPAVIFCGEHFVGLQMPLNEISPTIDYWRHTLVA